MKITNSVFDGFTPNPHDCGSINPRKRLSKDISMSFTNKSHSREEITPPCPLSDGVIAYGTDDCMTLDLSIYMG